MNSNKGRDAELEDREKYEATVLEFLDKEMASVQPAQKRDEQSDELDALVTDLLKQVITEADQPKEGNKLLLDDEDELFAGLTTEQKKSSISMSTTPGGSAEQAPAGAPAAVPAAAVAPPPEEPETAVKPQPVPETETARATPASVSAFSMVSKQRMPVLLAAAACALVIIGAAIYFYLGHSSKTMNPPKTQTALSEPAEPATQPISGSVEPAAAPKVQPAVLPSPSKGSAANPGVSAQGKKQAAPVVSPAATKPKSDPLPVATVPPAPVREERVPTPQPSSPAPAPAPVVAAVEKPSTPTESESAAPVNPLTMGRKPVPLMPAVNPVLVTSSPAPQPASQPAAAAPAVPKPLMAALPISQVSPVFPELALRSRSSGTVVLELQINDQGKVVKATPVAGPAIFHEAAVSAAMKWRYKPASIGGVNVPSQSKVTMVFNLKR